MQVSYQSQNRGYPWTASWKGVLSEEEDRSVVPLLPATPRLFFLQRTVWVSIKAWQPLGRYDDARANYSTVHHLKDSPIRFQSTYPDYISHMSVQAPYKLHKVLVIHAKDNSEKNSRKNNITRQRFCSTLKRRNIARIHKERFELSFCYVTHELIDSLWEFSYNRYTFFNIILPLHKGYDQTGSLGPHLVSLFFT